VNAPFRDALTFDLEEYFQVANYRDAIPRASWDGLARRSPSQVAFLLDLLGRARARATFFTLGWVAEREPGLVREIAEAGHEVGSHGYDHRFVHDLGPKGFREDLRRTRDILEALTGKPVRGFRASTFTVTERTPWALAILAEEGYAYDSSVFPVRHPTYGMPRFSRFPVSLTFEGGRRLLEFPPLTLRVAGTNLPVGGGGYFRLFPLSLLLLAVRRFHRAGYPAAIYLHPWELDPDQPRVAAGALARFRHRVGLRGARAKLDALLDRLEFAPMGEVLGERFGGTS
jgi:polysaccharide deacetylase family protein (PEP-CTERM system associated)